MWFVFNYYYYLFLVYAFALLNYNFNFMCRMKRPHNCGQVPMPIINKEQIEKEACTVSGYMTLATRNGDSVVHGLLPSILSHSHGNTSFNTCLHGTDGNWCDFKNMFMILSCGLKRKHLLFI